MAQPTTQELLDAGHAFYGYFWYANDTGLWDARVGAMATKTGTGSVTADGDGGANVANSTGSTSYTPATTLSYGPSCTLSFKVKQTSAGDSGICWGDMGTSYFWLRASEIRMPGLTTGNSGSATWATFTIVRLSDGAGKLYKNGAFVADAAWVGTNNISRIMAGYSGGLALSGALEFFHFIPGLAASAAEVSSLYADPYQALAASGGATATLATITDAAAFAGIASVSPLTVITATMADAVFSGTASAGAMTSLAITTDAAVFSGSASVAGTASITLPVLKNNTGTVLASETGATAYIYAITGAHVVTKSAQTTNGSGVMVITDAALVAATQYRVVIVLASGAEGMDKATAA